MLKVQVRINIRCLYFKWIMLHCQISISHGRLFGLRIIFAMDAEHLNLADFLTEISCKQGSSAPPGRAAGSAQPRVLAAGGTRSALESHPPPASAPAPHPRTPSRGRAGCAGPAAAPCSGTRAVRRVPALPLCDRVPPGRGPSVRSAARSCEQLGVLRVASTSQLAFEFNPNIGISGSS